MQRKLFDWVLANVGEQGFREWRAFDHPQLGPVEVGGMVYIWSYRNPPGKLLEKVCHDNTLFNMRHAAALRRHRRRGRRHGGPFSAGVAVAGVRAGAIAYAESRVAAAARAAR